MAVMHWFGGFWKDLLAWLSEPLKGNYLASTVTAVVGSSALLIYLLQKRSHRRDIAKLVILEIEYAEKVCRDANTPVGFEGYLRLLPSNSWNANRHLFVGEFKKAEFDLITGFYARATDIDALMDEFVRQLNNSHLTLLANPNGGVVQINPQIIPDGTNQNIHTRLVTDRNEILNHPLTSEDLYGKLKKLSLGFWRGILARGW